MQYLIINYDGNVDTYTITLTNGTTYTFTVTNGVDGKDGKDGGAVLPIVISGASFMGMGAMFILKMIDRKKRI